MNMFHVSFKSRIADKTIAANITSEIDFNVFDFHVQRIMDFLVFKQTGFFMKYPGTQITLKQLAMNLLLMSGQHGLVEQYFETLVTLSLRVTFTLRMLLCTVHGQSFLCVECLFTVGAGENRRSTHRNLMPFQVFFQTEKFGAFFALKILPGPQKFVTAFINVFLYLSFTWTVKNFFKRNCL